MIKLQPLLVPCKGVLGDLYVQVDPSRPRDLLIYWGTAILQVVSRDRESLSFRMTACFLLNMRFRIGVVAKAFGLTENTLRSWQRAFNEGCWEQTGKRFSGPGAPKKLSAEVEQYVRGCYREAVAASHTGRMPYGFRDRMCKKIRKYWPEQEVSPEVIRKIFRSEDDKLAAAGADAVSTCDTGVSGGEVPAPDPGRESQPGGSCEVGEHPVAESTSALRTDLKHMDQSGVPQALDEALAGQDIRGASGQPSANGDGDHTRKVAADSRAAANAPNHPVTIETTGSSDAQEAPCHGLPNPQQPCESAQNFSAAPDQSSANASCSTSVAAAVRTKPGRKYLPVLSGNGAQQPFFCQHAGFLMLAPEFDLAFGHLAPILRQTAAQILCGAVNQEQAKLIDYTALEKMVGKVIRDRDHQRTLLDRWSEGNDIMAVYQGNLFVVDLPRHGKNHDFVVLYCDTHQEPYKGIEKVLPAWNANNKCVEMAIAQEFVHTEQGQPFFAGHFDNFYDPRMRFLLIRAKVCALLGPGVKLLWVFDRGYWGIEFLERIAALGDYFIIWEKGYEKDGWSQPFDREGDFELIRQGNKAADRRITVGLAFREQQWKPNSFDAGRRLIVRVRRDSSAENEVAVVTNAPGIPARTVITTIFGRFGAQENDFSYEGRHFGINELTARSFDPYQEIAGELTDREVDSRAYKANRKQKSALDRELATQLFKLDGMEPTSLEQVEKQRDKVRRRRDRLQKQYEDARKNNDDMPDKMIDRFRDNVAKLRDRFRDLHRKEEQAEKRTAGEQEAERLRAEIKQTEEDLGRIDKKESRILMLIEERYVRPNMARKELVDALRMTSRNVFGETFETFRTDYDNFREDHQVFRALTQAPGMVIPRRDRLDIYLFPGLEVQPAQWSRIEQFLQHCRARILRHFAVDVRFLTRVSHERIIHAAWTAQQRCRTP